jgi:hypothetical protein
MLGFDSDWDERIDRNNMNSWVLLQIPDGGSLGRIVQLLDGKCEEFEDNLGYSRPSEVHFWADRVTHIFLSVRDDRDVVFEPGCMASNPDYLRFMEWGNDDDYSPRYSGHPGWVPDWVKQSSEAARKSETAKKSTSAKKSKTAKK